MDMPLLAAEHTALLIIDIQDKLMAVMGNPDRVMDRATQLLRLARVFDLPVILTEQYSRWLGPTLTPIKEALTQYDPIEKRHFDCCEVPEFSEMMNVVK
ncbi:MAG: isochorismatase family protein [Deltaproteobacteria bacterium]|nr:isochorismatase family protein [Deltaproteobacteria bacterium]